MTDVERNNIAEALLALIFSLREDNGAKSQSWVLGIATTALSRAILGSIGPRGDPTALLQIAHDQVLVQMEKAQTDFFKEQLSRPPDTRRPRG